MELILAIIFQIAVTFAFINILRIYYQNGNFKKMLHVYGVLCPINAYFVHSILFVAILYMKNAVVNDLSDPSFKVGSEMMYYGPLFGQVGGLLFCLLALELLPVAIDRFQDEKGLRKIKLLKWITCILFGFTAILSIIVKPSLKLLPKAINNYVGLLTFVWPFYSIAFQMTTLNMLLKHLMKHFAKYVSQAPETSKKLMKALKYMLISNASGLTLFGLGFLNHLFIIITSIPMTWNILIMMFGMSIIFITQTYLAFYIFNIKKLVTNHDMVSTLESHLKTKSESNKN